MSKSSDLGSIPYKVLDLLETDISKQLADLSDLSFLFGVFPSLLKIVKTVLVFKANSKLFHQNYRPTSLLSNAENNTLKTNAQKEFINCCLKLKLSMTFALSKHFLLSIP